MSEGHSWWRRPLRIIQTVLREIDIQDYDPEAVIAYVRRMHGNVLVVNAAGIFAFYPTNIPEHRRNPFLGEAQDMFAELVPLAHRHGIRVIGRVDFRGGHREVYDDHPDWFSHDAAGHPRRTQFLYASCPNGYYRNEYAEGVLREVLERLQVDGIWENAASFHGICHCEACRRSFKEETGLDLPQAESWDDPRYGPFLEWKYRSVYRHSRRFRDLIKSYGPDKAYVAEFPGPYQVNWQRGGLDIQMVAEFFDFLVCCHFVIVRDSYGSPFTPYPVWSSGTLIKYLRSIGRGRTAVNLFSHLEQTSRYAAEPPHELRAWMAEILASGGSFWDCTFVGSVPDRFLDRRNLEVVEDLYGFFARHEPFYVGQQSLSEVAIVYSRRSQDRFGQEDPRTDGYWTHARGFEASLREAHIPYDVLAEADLSPEALGRYRVVILPNHALMSDATAALLRAYVAAGGGLVATFQTGMFDEAGAAREVPALADVFGVRYLGVTYRDLPYAYQWVRGEHPLTQGLGPTRILAYHGDHLAVEALPDAEAPLGLIPEIFPQPPERAWTPVLDTRQPTVVGHRYGEGRAVFFPGQVDRLCIRDGHPDFRQLLVNAVLWALGGRPVLETDLPESVHVHLYAHEPSGALHVHLVNYTSGPRRPVGILVPVRDGRIAVATDRRPTGVRLLRSGREVPVEWDGLRATFTVPEVRDFEVAVLSRL